MGYGKALKERSRWFDHFNFITTCVERVQSGVVTSFRACKLVSLATRFGFRFHGLLETGTNNVYIAAEMQYIYKSNIYSECAISNENGR